ncbi:hypothetical protein [Parafrankia sp. EUN1f]|uniref:hypothetical protein n=1 Tax=Parafrankia sp. EUN1f TaxID=102897 RepID=UPI0001C4524E|nr:hypothetical protein [Parafrankia sp. EUN1f]EFC79179.1 hypothetical protein FrEUN1fDRAFT_7710 [Parafrankia sp. EUN1f]
MTDLTGLRIVPDIERAPWTDLTDAKDGRLTRIGLQRNGTTEGRATVGIVVQLDDGTHVIARTTWRLLQAAVRGLAAGPVGSEETQD